MGLFDWFRGKKAAPARTRVEFQRLAIEMAGEVDGVVTAAPHEDPDEFAIVVEKQGQQGLHTTYLTNVWRQLADADVDEQREGMRHFLDSTVNAPDIPETWAELRSMLLPVLRSAGLTSWALSQPQSLVWKPATPFLVELLVIDLGPSVTYVTGSKLDGWGVTVEEAFRVAHENLAAIVPKAPERQDSDGPTLFHIVSGQIDGGSYLLSPGWLASYTQAVGGRPIAYAGGREFITVTSVLSPESVAGLAQMALDSWNGSSRPLSPCLYTVTDDDRLVPFSVPDDHPGAIAVARARLPLAGGEYAAQKEALDAHHESELIDVFVASLMAREPDDGKPITLAVWTHGIRTWLPVTDTVALLDPDTDEPPLEVALEAVLEVAEGCLAPVEDVHPRRYETVRWPSEQELEALRSRQV